MLLAGDIGGTKINLTIFSPEAGPREPLVEATFPSADYPNLEALAGEFLAKVDFEAERAGGCRSGDYHQFALGDERRSDARRLRRYKLN